MQICFPYRWWAALLSKMQCSLSCVVHKPLNERVRRGKLYLKLLFISFFRRLYLLFEVLNNIL